MSILSVYPLAIITFTISVIFVYVYLRSRKNPENMLFAVMGFFLTVFLSGQSFSQIAGTSGMKILLLNISYSGLSLFLGAYYHFVVSFLGKGRGISAALVYTAAVLLSAYGVSSELFVTSRVRGSIPFMNLIVLVETLVLSGILIRSYFHPTFAKVKEPLSAFFLGGAILFLGTLAEILVGKAGLFLEYGLMGLTLTIGLSLTNEIIRLYRTSSDALKKLEESYMSTMEAFISALDAKDPFTSGHSERVTKLSVAMATELNLDEESIKNLRLAALLHDAGKLVINEDILLKKEKLTDEEFRILKNHAAMGAEILKPIYFLRNCLAFIRSHHERPDGKGYPDGLKGDAIPVPAALIAIAEAFDAIVTESSFRKGKTIEEAVKELKNYRGTQFSEVGVDAFLRIHEREKENFKNYINSMQIKEKS